MTELSSEESGGTPGDVLMAIHEFGSMNKGKELRKFLTENGDSFWDGTDDEVKRRCVPLRDRRSCGLRTTERSRAGVLVDDLPSFGPVSDSEASAAPIEGDVFYRQRPARLGWSRSPARAR